MPLQSLPTGTPKSKIKIIVAMSGGVDSSVAAALLKRAGFNIVGVFMKLWASPRNRCCSPESEKRARQVAAKLKIPFYVFNFEKEFKKRIVDYFLDEYQAGGTPNPCVVCNKEIKFGLLLDRAMALGADYVATGHYAKLDMRCPTGHRMSQRLLRAKDENKDQSYFLWQLSQAQLKKVLFPIGDYTKRDVRNLAKKFGLPTYNTPESMEICFVQTTINEFLIKHIKAKPGKLICLEPGSKQQVLGKHQDLAFYTIGQRKGIGLPGGPYWVMKKDLKENYLIVTKNEKDLYQKELVFKNANWLFQKQSLRDATGQAGKIKAKIRYRSKLASGVLAKNNKFIFNKPQRAITPGQSVVFYCGNELLGGGVIS